MRVGYFADGAWSHKALELIVAEDDIQIAFITPRYDTQDPILRQWAEKLKVPYIPHRDVNSDAFLDEVSGFNADIFVSMSFNQILKRNIIDRPSLGVINCHAGKLPFYRGRNPLNWALINGEKEFGITVHYVDEGIDTGDIIEQKTYEISDDDNYATLLKLAYEECGRVLLSAIKRVKNGLVIKKRQVDIHPVGSYFCQRTVGDELVDFNWDACRLFNFIRGITIPGPCARFFVSNQEYAMVEVKKVHQAPKYISTVGEIVGRTEDGNILKIGDSLIRITKISEIKNGVLTDIIKPNFKIGTRLRSM